MHASNLLSKGELGKLVDQVIYRDVIGSLLYLTSNRPNIVCIVCLCARFQFDPRESHLKIVKRILHYVVGTTNQCQLYKKNQDFKLVGYCDANFVRDRLERKSTSGGCYYIGPCLISLATKKQNFIALSIVEVEYVSIVSCCSQMYG